MKIDATGIRFKTSKGTEFNYKNALVKTVRTFDGEIMYRPGDDDFETFVSSVSSSAESVSVIYEDKPLFEVPVTKTPVEPVKTPSESTATESSGTGTSNPEMTGNGNGLATTTDATGENSETILKPVVTTSTGEGTMLADSKNDPADTDLGFFAPTNNSNTGESVETVVPSVGGNLAEPKDSEPAETKTLAPTPDLTIPSANSLPQAQPVRLSTPNTSSASTDATATQQTANPLSEKNIAIGVVMLGILIFMINKFR